MKKMIRYVVAGVTATGTKIAILYALTEWVGIWYLYSSAIGFCIALCISFTLQKFWTFQRKETIRLRTEAMQFLFVAFGGLLFNAGAVYTLVEYAHLHYIVAQLFVAVFIAFANFLLYNFIFRAGEKFSLSALWYHELGEWERGLIIAGGVSFVLFAIKFLGLELPYHQDEWKTAHFIVDPAALAGIFHHPPLTELLYRVAGFILAPELFRLIPLAFTAGSFALLYLILERRAGFKAALLSIVLFGTSAYGAVAALMLDLDGAILPFFMLLSVYAYDRAREARGSQRFVFLALLLLALILGFLIKLSFVLVVGALIVDYLYERRRDITLRDMMRLGSLLAAFFALMAFFVWVAQFMYPSFDPNAMVTHALTYVQGFDRAWGQIAFQASKALIYLGPFVLAGALFMSRETFERTRIFFVYLGLGSIFYFVLFDFSQGALDKYLMFTIVPFCAIAGVSLAPYLPKLSKLNAAYIGALAIFSLALCAVNFLPHEVLPLYPKSMWAKEVLALHWNILIPFFGGSGPLGFYVSFLFIALSFVTAGLLTFAAIVRKKVRPAVALALIVLSIFYAGIFTEELFFGRINGSAPQVLREALVYIKGSESVTSVITHNDIGAFELWQMDRYTGRFYAAPQFESVHRELFAKHTGHYLVVDIPYLNKESFYGKFFSACKTDFTASSGAITATVYRCPSSDPYAIK